MKKFKRTVFAIEVLSEEHDGIKPVQDLSIGELMSEITDKSFSSHSMSVVSDEEISPVQMSALLESQGELSDFFDGCGPSQPVFKFPITISINVMAESDSPLNYDDAKRAVLGGITKAIRDGENNGFNRSQSNRIDLSVNNIKAF